MRLANIIRFTVQRSKGSSLRSNFVWMFVGNAIYSACQWLLISVLAKMTTPEAVGKYALAIAITAPLMYLANFSVGVMLVTDTLRQTEFKDYRNTRLVLIALSFLATAGICIASGFSRELFLLTLVVGVAQFSDCLSELYRSAMFRSEMMPQVALSLILRGSLSVLVTVLILYRSRNVLWALAGLAVSRIAVLVAFDISMSRRVTGQIKRSPVVAAPRSRPKQLALGGLLARFNFRSMMAITRTAFPLTIVTVLTSLVLNIPRYFIEHYVGHRELGIFAAMWSLLTAGNMVAIEQCDAFCAFFEEHNVHGGSLRQVRRWMRAHAEHLTLDLSRISDSRGRTLVWHAHYRDATYARGKYSVSISRENIELGALVGRANRYLTWENIKRFKANGLAIYDLGGWYAGKDDQKLLAVNRFKEQWGGRIMSSFHCTRALTLKGAIFLWGTSLRGQLARTVQQAARTRRTA